MVEPGRHAAVEVLLRVLRTDRLEQPAEARDVAGRRSRDDSVVERRDVGGLGPAARDAGHAEARRIDLGTRSEVVERADAVPGEVACRGAPREKALGAEIAVLRCRAAYARALCSGVVVLQPLPLTGRIDGEDDEALPDQIQDELLIPRRAEGDVGVADDVEDRGRARLAVDRHE